MISQCARILEYLQTGDEISWREAFDLFECAFLSQRIADLKKAGHNITSRMSTNPTSGNKLMYYSLIKPKPKPVPLRADQETTAKLIRILQGRLMPGILITIMRNEFKAINTGGGDSREWNNVPDFGKFNDEEMNNKSDSGLGKPGRGEGRQCAAQNGLHQTLSESKEGGPVGL